jgi:large subunit ribosomal protein L4e
MKKIPIFSLAGDELEKISIPRIFLAPIREDVIHKVFVHQLSHRIQPKGRYPLAGRETSAESFGVGLGLARLPRVKHGPLRGVAAVSNMARGGRKPHVTTPEKRIYKQLNKKERLLGIAAAVAATGSKYYVERRGHIIDKVLFLPLIIEDDLESIDKTREFREFSLRVGIYEDILRVRNNVKLVGGKAKWRGRGRKVRKGPLIVYNEDRGIVKAARNIEGVDVVSAKEVSVIHLAPGGVPGRLTVWSKSAVETIEERLGYVLRRVVMK